MSPTRMSSEDFIARTVEEAGALPEGTRQVIAIAGPPGGGKSTVAEALVDAVNAAHPGHAALLPMDGFHFDDEVLVPRGWRPRKGAPHTFDVGGLAAMLRRLRANEEEFVAVPRFDRDIEIARAAARIIGRDARLIVCEGNYLLLDRPPWDALAPLFDRTVMIRVPEAVLADRLRERWVHFGLDEEGIRAKLEDNDLPNGRLIYAESRPAEVEIVMDG